MTTKATEPAQAAPAVGCQVEQPVRPLVERLRSYSADEMLCDRYADAMQDAAEEIDRQVRRTQKGQTMSDSELLEEMARVWVDGGGDVIGIAYCTRRLHDAVQQEIDRRKEDHY
jgi:hypothetical protein